MIDNGKLTPHLDILCWIDSFGKLYHKPFNVIVHMEDVIDIEEEHKDLKGYYAEYNKLEEERKEYERRQKARNDILQARITIESLECKNEDLKKETKSLWLQLQR